MTRLQRVLLLVTQTMTQGGSSNQHRAEGPARLRAGVWLTLSMALPGVDDRCYSGRWGDDAGASPTEMEAAGQAVWPQSARFYTRPRVTRGCCLIQPIGAWNAATVLLPGGPHRWLFFQFSIIPQINFPRMKNR
jgi:hypothetical protein